MWISVVFITGAVITAHGAVLWECNNFPSSGPVDGCDWNRTDFNWEQENIAGVPDPAGKPGNALRIFYRNGSLVTNDGNKGGTQFKAYPFLPADELTLEYEVYFSPNFDFVKGGKLPGFFGGTGHCSNAKHDETCFSTRFMWRADGDGEVYAYLPNEKGDWFCTTPFVHCNFIYGNSFGRGSWRMKPGRWYTLSQTIKLNSVGSSDGEITIHVDGAQVYHIDGLTFRSSKSLQITAIYFSTFFGGCEPSWQSTADVYTYYRNFKVTD